MSLIFKKLLARQIIRYNQVLSGLQTRNASYWAPNFVPGPYPKTEEEKKAAAKKYNLLPEEYEPLPDDGAGFGDYPKLPFESVCSRDPNYPWDDEELRRNFMDPVHHRIINLLPEQDPADVPFLISLKNVIFYNLIPVGIICSIMYYLHTVHFHHGNKKQYPKPGAVHYTFELEDVK